jgi:excisionase family DNA binding protein
VAKVKKTAKKAGKIHPAHKTARFVESGKETRLVEPVSVGQMELLDMEQAIDQLKTTRPTFYRWLRSGRIRGMKVGRQWRFEKNEIERFLKGEPPRIELRTDISPLIRLLAAKAKEFHAPQISLAGETGVEQAVKLMIELGIALKASDIHLSPHDVDHQTVGILRYRIDGVLKELARIDSRLLSGIIEQWRILAGCNLLEDTPQEGRIKFEIVEEKKAGEILFCYLPTYLGGSFTARNILLGVKQLTLDDLDYSPRDKEKLLRWIHAPNGLILSTGPAGSGKTTVIYVCLNCINRPEIKILTIEEPVQMVMPWMLQIQVGEKMSYADAVRAIGRSDPDVVFIGELCDGEVVELTHRLSLTGHLVMSQLHVDEAAKGLTRMVEMGAEPFTVAESTKLVISQRLVRRLCPDCSEPETLPPDLLARIESYARVGGLDWETLAKNFRKPVGCDKCKKLGYRGRLPIAEFLEVTPEIGEALRRGATADELRKIAVGQGMTTIAADGIRKSAEGKTTIDEVIRTLALR